MERTLIILKPSCVKRGLIGQITQRFEQKGLLLVGMKMVQLDDELLNEHYSHLQGKPFFSSVKQSMKDSPVVMQCWQGVDAVHVVRNITGYTNGRSAASGTIRGDFSMSVQENIVHASDSKEAAAVELQRFFKKEEIFDYKQPIVSNLYSSDEAMSTINDK